MHPVTATLLAGVLSTTLGCASWKRFAYEGWGRDRWQQPDRVLEAIGVHDGERVADVGAGGGYFTFRLAKAVGSTGVVYAVDVDPDMIDYLRTRARDDGFRNVEVVAAPTDAPGLPPQSIDLLFMSNTYHHIEDPVAYFRNARRCLRDGGRVAILDLNDSGWFAWLFGHNTSAEKLRADMAQAGYRVAAEHSFVPEQTFIVFVPVA
ncbi:MAG TPA: class I SAM-dependent methyltransferase [Candidatus Binatia bacterium]|nr:class I SAM-dependent methyltransferase [Candidatus Binatia bacterium]